MFPDVLSLLPLCCLVSPRRYRPAFLSFSSRVLLPAAGHLSPYIWSSTRTPSFSTLTLGQHPRGTSKSSPPVTVLTSSYIMTCEYLCCDLRLHSPNASFNQSFHTVAFKVCMYFFFWRTSPNQDVDHVSCRRYPFAASPAFKAEALITVCLHQSRVASLPPLQGAARMFTGWVNNHLCETLCCVVIRNMPNNCFWPFYLF